MIRSTAISLAAAVALAAPAWAQKSADDHSAHHGAAKAASGPLADGEVRKVDKAAKKITIKHGPVASINMPAMTMVFRVDDAGLLDKVKPGDKVKFDARKTGDKYMVTRIEPVK